MEITSAKHNQVYCGYLQEDILVRTEVVVASHGDGFQIKLGVSNNLT